MKKFVMFPDASGCRLTSSNQLYLEQVEMTSIEFLIEYFSMNAERAEGFYKFFTSSFGKVYKGAFFALDISYCETQNTSLYTVFLCDELFAPLDLENMTIRQYRGPSAQDYRDQMQSGKPITWELS